MPFHSKFNFHEIIQSLTKAYTPKDLGFKYTSWNSINLRNLKRLKPNRLAKILKVLPLNEAAELAFAYRLMSIDNKALPWSQFIPGAKAKELFDNYRPLINESRVFKVKRDDLKILLNTVADKNAYRMVVKFGCVNANTGLSLFITAMKAGELIQINHYIECVDVESDSSTTPKTIDSNFDNKTLNYYNIRANRDNFRRGIAHYIQTAANPNKIGIEEFMSSRNDVDEYLYLHMGKGSIKINDVPTTSADYTTIVFSHFNSISGYSLVGVESNTFYDVGSACCPPQ